MKKTWLVLGTAALTLVLAGCAPKAEDGSGGPAAAEGEIVIGEYSSLTGSEETFGQSTHDGVMLAIDEVNAAGGVDGRRIRVITEDDQSKPDEAANAVTKLISQNNVVAILGEVASSNTLAAAPICQANQVPMITPASTHLRVTQVGDYVFRTCFVDTYQGEVLGNYIAQGLGMTRAAILFDAKSEYSTALAELFRETFEANGGTVVTEQKYAKGDLDFEAQLAAIAAAAPQIVFIPGYYTEVGNIAVQARKLGLTMPMAGGDGWESPRLLETAGTALEGSFYTNHFHVDDPAAEVQEFVEKYRRRYGAQPDAVAALAYDAARLLADAIARAGSTDGVALRDAIASTADFAGVTGRITFGPERNPIGKKLVVLEIRDSKTALKAVLDPEAAVPAETADTAATAPGVQ